MPIEDVEGMPPSTRAGIEASQISHRVGIIDMLGRSELGGDKPEQHQTPPRSGVDHRPSLQRGRSLTGRSFYEKTAGQTSGRELPAKPGEGSMHISKSGQIALAAAAAGIAVTPAIAQDDPSVSSAQSPVYGAIRIGAGTSFATRFHSISPRVTAITGQKKSSISAVGTAALGFRPAGLPLRFELEGSWRGDVQHRIDAVGACTVALCGMNFNFQGNERARIRSKSLMANAYYDRPLGSDLSLFVGGGVGVAQLRSSAVQHFTIVQAPFAGTQTGSIWPSRTRTNFAFSATAGLDRRLSRKLTFEIGGRYLSMGRYDTGYNVNLFRDERFSAHVATAEGFIGVRFGL